MTEKSWNFHTVYHPCGKCNAYHFMMQIERFQMGWKKNFFLPFFKIFLAFFSDKVCTFKGLGNYGITADTGVNRLKGPGVYEAPGAAHMGGRLPFRLAEMCESYRKGCIYQPTSQFTVWKFDNFTLKINFCHVIVKT